MFRAQQNAFDDVVAKATDENLTSENWGLILDVCDKVQNSESGAKDATQALIKRLAHRNANVQLYTLELANALSQNCGIALHKELASRSFTDALLRLAGDRNTHQQVKTKIVERMGEWADMFARDPDLGIMHDAYMKLKASNPTLRAPSKPQKTQITDVDRQKEEEELQMALQMSIQESKGAGAPQAASMASQQSPSGSQPGQSTQPTQPLPAGTTAATVSRVRALFDFTPSEPGELQFCKGDVIAVLESVYKDWWKGSLRGQTGIFPLNYVEKLQDPTREELEREAQMEADVFAQIRNVEKLLALLSTSSQGPGADVRDNDEITELYHSTLAIRPKLIELIGKYSQKKDDFTQLNEKFIKARRDYESLLEASMSQPQQPAYARPYGYNMPPSGGYAGYPASSPPLQQPSQYPPAGSNPAFYMVPPTQQTQHPQQHPKQHPPLPSQANDMRAPPASQQRIPSGARPQSFAPQELATGQSDSPVDNRQSFVLPPQQQTQPQNPYEQVASPYQHQPPPAQPHLHDGQTGYGYPPSQPPQSGQSSQPSHVPPPQPSHAPPVPPGTVTSPPPGPTQPAYLPYRPGASVPNAPAVGGAGSDEGFYR